MSRKGGQAGLRLRLRLGGEEKRLVVRDIGESMKDRLPDAILVAFVVLVQIAWGATLVYLGVRFL
jgi:hypothetical protein